MSKSQSAFAYWRDREQPSPNTSRERAEDLPTPSKPTGQQSPSLKAIRQSKVYASSCPGVKVHTPSPLVHLRPTPPPKPRLPNTCPQSSSVKPPSTAAVTPEGLRSKKTSPSKGTLCACAYGLLQAQLHGFTLCANIAIIVPGEKMCHFAKMFPACYVRSLTVRLLLLVHIINFTFIQALSYTCTAG